MRTVVELDDTENYFRPPCMKFKLALACNDGWLVFVVFDKKDGA